MRRLLFERHHPPARPSVLPIPGTNPPRAPSKYADPSQPSAHRLRANLQGSQHVQAHALKFPWRVVVIPTTGKIIFVEVKPSPKSGFPGSGVRRNKYEYFGFWRSACVNSASPSSADIPESLGPPNVDIFPSTRKRIPNRLDLLFGWFFLPRRRLGAGFFFETLHFAPREISILSFGTSNNDCVNSHSFIGFRT